MKNLDEIKEKYGNRPPFSVPENYFEQFTGKMMDRLPEKEEKKAPVVSLWSRIKPVVYLAAMFAAAIWSVNLLTGNHPVRSVAVANNAVVAENEQEAESVSMVVSVDDYSLYEYMSEGATN
jgi:hypothetical protein